MKEKIILSIVSSMFFMGCNVEQSQDKNDSDTNVTVNNELNKSLIIVESLASEKNIISEAETNQKELDEAKKQEALKRFNKN